MPPHLLKIGELRNFHAVAPHFPAETPRAERRAFPIILDKTNVMQRRVESDLAQRTQIELLNVRRCRLHDHLELIVVLKPVRILAIAAVLRAARGLDISRAPRPGAERAQGRRRVERARAHLHIIGLENEATLPRPVVLERQDEILKCLCLGHVSSGFAGGRNLQRQPVQDKQRCHAGCAVRPGCDPARCGRRTTSATIAAASTADAIGRLKLRPP